MAAIITGNFEQQDDAVKAISDLADAGFLADQTATFFVHPPIKKDPPTEGVVDPPKLDDASIGAMSGAALGGVVGVAVGLVSLPALGPGAAVAGAGVGAYVGSLAGAMAGIEDKNIPEEKVDVEAPFGNATSVTSRNAGTLVAVSAPGKAQQSSAIGILRGHGASDIEQTEGTIETGRWTDYDPFAPVKLVTA